MKEDLLVVARYKEDVSWLQKIPAGFSTILYNKSPMAVSDIFPNIDLKSLPNVGREAHTIVHFILNDYQPGRYRNIVFAQGDPFEHSPDFLKLLHYSSQFRSLQPLTWTYRQSLQIPPIKHLMLDQTEYLHGNRVRTHFYSLHTWSPIEFFDQGAVQIADIYIRTHGLRHGDSIAEHCLRSWGFDKMADLASRCEIGRFCYGAMFSVADELLAEFLKSNVDRIRRLEKWIKEHDETPWILERLWLHLLGSPFLKLRRQ